jgi:LacI family transcriptional regulator
MPTGNRNGVDTTINMPTTVKEIALAAGVSKAVVSKVLHGASSTVRVSESRAQQIRDLAEQLGYVANENARSLRKSRTNTIGLYFDDLAGISSGPLYTPCLLDGVCQVVFRRHFRVALIAEVDSQNMASSLGDGRLDGVIWCRMVRDRKTLSVLERAPIPIVALTTPPVAASGNVRFIACDNEGGMESAVDHLWSLGHRKILFLYESREEEASDCADRRNGFIQAMNRRGATTEVADFQAWSWHLDEFDEWWAAEPEHTAVICWSERCAGRLIEKCNELAVGVPEQLSVLGFDSTHYCESTKPPLTAVRQPILEMAKQAATVLLDLIEGKPSDPVNPVFQCPVDLRASTSIPRSILGGKP